MTVVLWILISSLSIGFICSVFDALNTKLNIMNRVVSFICAVSSFYGIMFILIKFGGIL